jgi:hypothetical protein
MVVLDGRRYGFLATFRKLAKPQINPFPTFSDALALVRKELWAHATFRGSPVETDTVKVPRGFVEHLTETLCYAA